MPTEFLPGERIIGIVFDGAKITWSVWTNDSFNKTAASSDNNSGVGGCNQFLDASARIADSTIETSDAELKDDKFSFDGSAVVIYPNPARDKFNVLFAERQESLTEVELIDSQGKMLRLDASWNAYSNSLEVDVSKLNHGLYLLQVKIGLEDRLFRIIKQ